jgi:uncharacterized membrane protein
LTPTKRHFARRGVVDARRRTMRGLTIGGCIAAGAFTPLPGRFLGAQLVKAIA